MERKEPAILRHVSSPAGKRDQRALTASLRHARVADCLIFLVIGATWHRTGPAIAAVSGIGYAGSLSGPVLIGWLAQLSSLRLALGSVIGLALLTVLLSRRLGQ